MAFVSEDKFDLYANGDLAGKNGGAGWGGAWVNAATQTQSVQGTTVYQGQKAVTISNGAGNTFYTRALAAGVSGDGNVLYFAIRRTLNNSGEISISARSNSGVNSRVAVKMNNAGNITLVGTTTVTALTGYSTSTQYAIRLTVNVTAGTATMAYSTGAYGSGGSWSAESSSVTLSSTGNIDAIGLGTDTSASTDTIDAITPFDLMATQLDVDSVANSTGTSVSSLTYSLNNVAGTGLIVGVCVNDGASAHITGVTYAGVAMTQAVTLLDDSPGSQTETALYYLASPATGSNNVIVSLSAGGLNINSGAISVTNANIAAMIGATTTKKQANGTTCTQDLTTTYDNSMVIDVWGQSGTSSANVPTAANQTSQWLNSTSRTAFGSSKTTTTAGAQTMAWSWTTSRITGGCLVEVRKISTVTKNLLLLGIGT